MGTIHKAKQMQERSGSSLFAALYLKSKGYSLESALWILCRTTLRK